MGKEFSWDQWAIDLVYHCMTELGKFSTVKVIWALPEGGPQLPVGYSKDIFLVKSWIMQAEVLTHPAIKVALLSCGFNGTLEVINAAKPVLCWPGYEE